MSDWNYQNPRLAALKLLLPILAWLVAILLPLVPVIRAPLPSDVQGYLFMGLVLFASCFWGVRARRNGSSIAFRLMTVVPLVLLGLSTIASLSIVLARMLSRG
jgi:hypothetical protein